MKVLVIGSGGREHALVWKIAQSPLLTGLIAAPGSAAIGTLAECVDIPVSDLDGLAELARTRTVDLVVVGPEIPLCDGLADKLRAIGIAVFGPSKAASMLETSKAFAAITSRLRAMACSTTQPGPRPFSMNSPRPMC